MTNADKVRQMTDKELWCWLCDLGIVCMCDYNPARCKNYVKCRECWKDWLAEEADENKTEEEEDYAGHMES